MKLSRLVTGGCAWLALLALAPTSIAQADLSACGDVDVRVQAQCVVVPPSAQCETMCTPISVEATCSARLAAQCQAGCDKLPSAQCSGSCMADCRANCTVDPGKFDCQADCQGECDGQCAASCATHDDESSCMASCSGACSVSCRQRCDVELPSADCDAACEASCTGACSVDPNLDCQIDCQGKAYAGCEADVMGRCETRCRGQQGALFCDGNYVDSGDRLQTCVDALKAELAAHVMASSSGSAQCDGGTCSVSGQAKVSTDCSVADVGLDAPALPAVPLLLALGVWLRRRRRRPL